METIERRILAVTSYGHFMSHFNMLVFPSLVLPLSRATGLELAGVLALSFWQYLLFGITALPWGLAADRWGARPFMALFFLGAGLCGVLAALFMTTPWALMLCLAGIGFFSGIYHPAGLGMISKGFKRVSLGMAYNGIFGNLGLALAPVVTGLVNWISGPAAAYLTLGGLNVVGLIMTLVMKVDLPEGEKAEAGKANGRSAVPFLILLAAMMLGGIAYRGATVILPTYFELKSQGLFQVLSGLFPGGLSPNLLATALSSIIFVIGMFGQYLGGRVGDRFEARKSYLVFHLLTLPPVFLMALTTDLPMVVLGVVYFFFLLGMQPIENTLVARLSPPRWHHSAYGAKFVLTFGVGALAVKLVGFIEVHFGIIWVFPALGCVSILLVVTILVLIAKSDPVRETERNTGSEREIPAARQASQIASR